MGRLIFKLIFQTSDICKFESRGSKSPQAISILVTFWQARNKYICSNWQMENICLYQYGFLKHMILKKIFTIQVLAISKFMVQTLIELKQVPNPRNSESPFKNTKLFSHIFIFLAQKRYILYWCGFMKLQVSCIWNLQITPKNKIVMLNNICNPSNCYFKIHCAGFLQSQQFQVQTFIN